MTTEEIAVGNLVIKSNRETLLNFFQLVGTQTEEAHIKVNGENSISIVALDPSHVSMLKAELNSDKLGWFTMTNTGYVHEFTVRTEEIIKLLKQFKKHESLTVTIDVNAHKIMISNDTTQSTINLIDSNYVHELPYIRFRTDAEFNIDVNDFARAIDTIAKISSSVTLKVGSGVEIENDGLPEGHYYARRPTSKITLEGKDYTNEIKITIDSITDLVSEMPILSEYKTEYLQKVLKILKQMTYESLNVKFGENVPIVISTTKDYTSRVNAKFYLAPLV